MSYVIHTSDPQGISVFLGEREWQDHILARHPELEPVLDEVGHTIEAPDAIHQDPEDDRVRLYYRSLSDGRRPHPKLVFLLVVVKYVDAPERAFQRTGFVSSVYFLKEMKRRGTQP